MMVRKYIIGENELCAFGETIGRILEDSLIQSCRTKASDLLRVLKRVKFENKLEPYIYEVEPQRLEEIRQGNLSSVTDEYNDKGLVIILDDNDYVLHIESKIYDVLVSKGDVYNHSDEIQSNIYLDPLTGYILYGTTVDTSNLLVGYGVLLDMVHGQTEGVVSVAGMYSTNMGYRCFGPVFFPYNSNEVVDAKGRQLNYNEHTTCPFCGGEIKLNKGNVECCENVTCVGRKIYGIYSMIGEGEIPLFTHRSALAELIDKGYDTVEKIEAMTDDDIHCIRKEHEYNIDLKGYIAEVLMKVHAYRWKLDHNQDQGVKAFLENFDKENNTLPLTGKKLFLINRTGFGNLSNELGLLGAEVEIYIDKITEDHILISENPESTAEVIDELHDFGLKKISVVNVDDCKTAIDVTAKLMDVKSIIEVKW